VAVVKTVHFFGDSFVAGFGDPAGLGWVGRVAEAAQQADTPFRAVNHGVPGATGVAIVEQWLRMTDDPRNRELPETKVVFSFGTNDVIAGLLPGETVKALQAALDRAKEIAVPALFVGPPPSRGLAEVDDQVAALSRLFGATCDRRGVPFIDTHEHLPPNSAWDLEAAASDGAHPQAAGYSELAELLASHGLLHWIVR
jgi:lysophospholipase L1-like esterase